MQRKIELNRSLFNQLPQELMLFLLSFLEPKDLARTSSISKFFHEQSNNEILWKHQIKKNFNLSENELVNIKNANATYKQLFINLLEIEKEKLTHKSYVILLGNADMELTSNPLKALNQTSAFHMHVTFSMDRFFSTLESIIKYFQDYKTCFENKKKYILCVNLSVDELRKEVQKGDMLSKSRHSIIEISECDEKFEIINATKVKYEQGEFVENKNDLVTQHQFKM